MKTACALIFAVVLGSSISHATKVLVDPKTVTISGLSFAEADLATVYGGIAGTCPPEKKNGTVCNTCGETGSLQACNQSSIYPELPITITFKTIEDISNSVAKFYILNAAGTTIAQTAQTLAAANYTVAGAAVTLTTTWGVVCAAAGMGSNCTSGATGVYLVKFGFGLDSDNNNDVDIGSTESRQVSVKIHYVAVNDPKISVNYCPGTATPGFCNMWFEPGDEKVYIRQGDGFTAVTGGPEQEASAIEFDAIAIFPIKVDSVAVGGAAVTGFKTGQAAPIIREIDPANNANIKSEEVTGGLVNYQAYCFIFGNRNKAQNIYRFVAGASAISASAFAPQICLSPSEVAGLLEDKHCFISTAAFGSDMAKEVQIFRKFRNQFLLTNELGRSFVKAYYEFGPPAAKFISQSEALRSVTRAALYPVLGFSYVALNYGILTALLTIIVLFILIFKIKTLVKQKKLLLFLFFLILTPGLKAQIVPQTKVIQHPDAQEGLVRITKDGTYIYDLKRPMKSESGRITFGHALQPEVSIDIERRNEATGAGTGEFQTFQFGELYEETESFIFGYDYEKFPWIGRNGKLGYQLGGALMFAQGHGILQSNLKPSREKFTFFTLPVFAGAVYRLEWKDRQLLAPYVAGGGTYTALVEKREDISTPQYTGAPGFYALGGVLLNVSELDQDSGYALDSEYGISNLWISLEYKAIEVNSDAFTFSNRYVNLGVSFDF